MEFTEHPARGREGRVLYDTGHLKGEAKKGFVNALFAHLYYLRSYAMPVRNQDTQADPTLALLFFWWDARRSLIAETTKLDCHLLVMSFLFSLVDRSRARYPLVCPLRLKPRIIQEKTTDSTRLSSRDDAVALGKG